MSVEASPSSFFRDLFTPVYAYLSRFTGAPSADVEDMVQDTILDAWRHRERFRSESSPTTWVLAIAKNKGRDWWRRRGRDKKADEVIRALRSMDSDPIPDEILDTDELRRSVRRALRATGEEFEDLLMRRYFDGRSLREMAADLGETEKAVESRLHRAREAFRQELRKEGEFDVESE